MSLGVCFYHEPPDLDTASGSQAAMDLWRTTGKAFGIHRFACIDKVGTASMNDSEVEFCAYPDTAAFLAGHEESSIWWAEPTWTYSKAGLSFHVLPWMDKRPEGWLFFGPAGGHGAIGPNRISFPQAGAGALHSIQAFAAMAGHLYSRDGE